MIRTTILIAVSMLLSLPSHAATYAYQNGVNGYSGTDDVFVSQYSSTIAFGDAGELFTGQIPGPLRYRTLIRFDLSTLAGQFTSIDSITLRLSVRLIAGVPGTLELRKVADLSPFGDPTPNWTEDSATWENTGLGIFLAFGLGPVLTTAPYGDPLQTTIDLTISDSSTATSVINSFLSGTNRGFALSTPAMSSGTASYVDVWSSEHEPVSERPQLIVNYTPAPEPSAILLATVGTFALFFVRRTRPK